MSCEYNIITPKRYRMKSKISTLKDIKKCISIETKYRKLQVFF